MSDPIWLVGPANNEGAISVRLAELGATPERVSVITDGMLPIDGVTEWVGIDAPGAGMRPGALVRLRAPDGPHDDPLAWGYIHRGRWSWEADEASSCFAHTDLIGARIARP